MKRITPFVLSPKMHERWKNNKQVDRHANKCELCGKMYDDFLVAMDIHFDRVCYSCALHSYPELETFEGLVDKINRHNEYWDAIVATTGGTHTRAVVRRDV